MLTDKQNPVGRLDMTSHSMSIAKAFADAGSPTKDAPSAGIAEYRNRIPMNPMLLTLMVQVAKSQAAIGFSDDAALYLRQAFDKALDQEVSLTPEQVFRYSRRGRRSTRKQRPQLRRISWMRSQCKDPRHLNLRSGRACRWVFLRPTNARPPI
ncbi:hypothetical protein HED63_26830 [Ochrobactrum cytisi]|nr:hypothetical protein [Brucella cytisi]